MTGKPREGSIGLQWGSGHGLGPGAVGEQGRGAGAGRWSPSAAPRILIDGAPEEGQGLLLQIFSKPVIGPLFFEVIQRKGKEGFGEGNLRALFQSIELDQARRGVL